MTKFSLWTLLMVMAAMRLQEGIAVVEDWFAFTDPLCELYEVHHTRAFGLDDVWPANSKVEDPEKCEDDNSHFIVFKDSNFGGPNNWFWPKGDVENGARTRTVELKEFRNNVTGKKCGFTLEGEFYSANDQKAPEAIEVKFIAEDFCTDKSVDGCQSHRGRCNEEDFDVDTYKTVRGHVGDSCNIFKHKGFQFGKAGSAKTHRNGFAMWFWCNGEGGDSEMNDFNADLVEKEDCPTTGDEITDVCLFKMRIPSGDEDSLRKCNNGLLDTKPHGMWLKGDKRFYPTAPVQTIITGSGNSPESVSFSGIFKPYQGSGNFDYEVDVTVSGKFPSMSFAEDFYKNDPLLGGLELKPPCGSVDPSSLLYYSMVSGSLIRSDSKRCEISLLGGPPMIGNGGNLHTYDSAPGSQHMGLSFWFTCKGDFTIDHGDFNLDFGACPEGETGGEEECPTGGEEEDPICIAQTGSEEEGHLLTFASWSDRNSATWTGYVPENGLQILDPAEFGLIDTNMDGNEVAGLSSISFMGTFKKQNYGEDGPDTVIVTLTMGDAREKDACEQSSDGLQCGKNENGIDPDDYSWTFYSSFSGTIESQDGENLPGLDTSVCELTAVGSFPQAGYRAHLKNEDQDGFSLWFKCKEGSNGYGKHDGDFNALFKACIPDTGGEGGEVECLFPNRPSRLRPGECVRCGRYQEFACEKPNDKGLPACGNWLIPFETENGKICIRCGRPGQPICKGCNDCEVPPCVPGAEPAEVCHDGNCKKVCVACGRATYTWIDETRSQRKWRFQPQCLSEHNAGLKTSCSANFVPANFVTNAGSVRICLPCGGLFGQRLEDYDSAVREILAESETPEFPSRTCVDSCNSARPLCNKNYIPIDAEGNPRYTEKDPSGNIVEFPAGTQVIEDASKWTCTRCGGKDEFLCVVSADTDAGVAPAINHAIGKCRHERLVATDDLLCVSCGNRDLPCCHGDDPCPAPHSTPDEEKKMCLPCGKRREEECP